MGGGVFPDPELGCGERSDSINPLPGKWSQQLERPWERPALAPDLVPLVTACPGTLPALLLPMQEEVGQPISPPRPPALPALLRGMRERGGGREEPLPLPALSDGGHGEAGEAPPGRPHQEGQQGGGGGCRHTLQLQHLLFPQQLVWRWQEVTWRTWSSPASTPSRPSSCSPS